MIKQVSHQTVHLLFEPKQIVLLPPENLSFRLHKTYDLDFLKAHDHTCKRYFQPIFQDIFSQMIEQTNLGTNAVHSRKFNVIKKPHYNVKIFLPKEFIFEIGLSPSNLPKHHKERELILAFQQQIQANLNDFEFFLSDNRNKGYALRKSLGQSLEPCFEGLPMHSISYCLLNPSRCLEQFH